LGALYVAPKIGAMYNCNSKFRKSAHSAQHTALRNYLIEQRKALGLSQRDLADRMQVTRSLIGKIETGERRLDVVEVIDYCSYLDIDPHEVVKLLLKS
jgi:ribosome-binding protein aMBF1 (putative translation factor)